MKWINGRKKPPIDNDEEFPRMYVVRFRGDDPRSGWVDVALMTAQQIADETYDDYWEYLDESAPASLPSAPTEAAVIYWQERCVLAEQLIIYYSDPKKASSLKTAWGKYYEFMCKPSPEPEAASGVERVSDEAFIVRLEELMKENPTKLTMFLLACLAERLVESKSYETVISQHQNVGDFRYKVKNVTTIEKLGNAE